MYFCTEGTVRHVADTFAAPSRYGFRLQRHCTHTSDKGTTHENQLVYQLPKLCPAAREARRIHVARDASVRPDLHDYRSRHARKKQHWKLQHRLLHQWQRPGGGRIQRAVDSDERPGLSLQQWSTDQYRYTRWRIWPT